MLFTQNLPKEVVALWFLHPVSTSRSDKNIVFDRVSGQDVAISLRLCLHDEFQPGTHIKAIARLHDNPG